MNTDELSLPRVFGKSFNATYVALIPKNVGVMELKDFRLFKC